MLIRIVRTVLSGNSPAANHADSNLARQARAAHNLGVRQLEHQYKVAYIAFGVQKFFLISDTPTWSLPAITTNLGFAAASGIAGLLS